MTVYLDTSVILSRFLGQANALGRWGDWERVYTSEITRVEFLRTLDALHLSSALAVEGTPENGLTFLTHDEQLARAVTAMGLPVLGV